jgi:hypothetical protein
LPEGEAKSILHKTPLKPTVIREISPRRFTRFGGKSENPMGNAWIRKESSMKTLSGLVLLLSALLAQSAAAGSLAIEPGEALQIRFTTNPAPDCGAACDILIFVLGFTASTADITSARLFDGTQLLGTYTTNPVCLAAGTCAGLVPAFVTATSLYGLSAPVIDFSSILAGTINGVLDITFTDPISLDLDSPFNYFGVLHATGPGSASGGYFKFFDSVAVVPVPEPESGSLLMMSVAVLGALIAGNRRSKQA